MPTDPYPSAAVRHHLAYLGLRNLAQTTRTGRRHQLVAAERWHDAELLDVDADRWERWYTRVAARVTPATRAGYLTTVRTFYAWALAEHRVPADPTARLPRPQIPRGLPRPVGEDDLHLALLTAPERVLPMLALAAFAGLRAHEIAALRADDVHPNTLVVRGKGSKERVVPLHPYVAELLRRLPVTGPLFPRRDGERGAIAAHRVSSLCNEHLHDVGVTATLHQLRHRFASSLYLVSEYNLRLVQETLGHSDPKTTARYAAWHRPDATRAVNLLPLPDGLPAPAHTPATPSDAALADAEQSEHSR